MIIGLNSLTKVVDYAKIFKILHETRKMKCSLLLRFGEHLLYMDDSITKVVKSVFFVPLTMRKGK